MRTPEFRVMEYDIVFTPLVFQNFSAISEVIQIPRELGLCGYRAISESFHNHFLALQRCCFLYRSLLVPIGVIAYLSTSSYSSCTCIPISEPLNS